MTVIYSDFGDTDTKVLKNIWKDLDVKEVRLTTNGNISMKKINKAIYDEEDTIIFCGHGSGEGCWNPSWNSGEFYTLSARNLRLLRAKKVIGIWCHASDFSKKYDVPGFSVGENLERAPWAGGSGWHACGLMVPDRIRGKACRDGLDWRQPLVRLR